jgi:hypothetical protein
VLQLLVSDLELVVKSGFVYLPLLFDPDIAREIQHRPETKGSEETSESEISKTVVEVEGRHFIKSLNIQSILANYENIDKDYHEKLKKDRLGQSSASPGLEKIAPNSKLLTIILKIMPYFIRKSRGLERKQLSDLELLDLISSKVDTPQSSRKQADKYLDTEPLLRRLNDLENLELTLEPVHDGLIKGDDLRNWFDKALGVQIVNREKVRLRQELHEREALGESQRNHIAMLLYITERGTFELDGFGLSRIGSSDDYLVYKRTGEYLLKDYYARSYMFPACRVAVSTVRPFRPMVLETYKHPFLHGYAPKQEICMREFNWPDEFTADNIIRILEEGINALLYGYDPRRRNGYHSLDPTRHYIKTIEFDDYRV